MEGLKVMRPGWMGQGSAWNHTITRPDSQALAVQASLLRRNEWPSAALDQGASAASNFIDIPQPQASVTLGFRNTKPDSRSEV